jgi:ABC-type transport system substrate-binding protein
MGLDWARPVELAQDARLRRGLLEGVDRDALREFLYPGFPDTSGDTFMLKDDERSQLVGRPFAEFRYDPARALADLAEAGWNRAADGRLLGRDGQQVQLEVRGSATDKNAVAFDADAWRRLGVDATEAITTGLNNENPEYRSTFPGVESTARGVGSAIFSNFDGRLQSLASNRWTAANRQHYSNATLDSLVDRIYASLDPNEQGLILKQAGEILATEWPALPQYFVIEFAASVKGVRAITDDFVGTLGPGTGPGLIARNAYLWDRSEAVSALNLETKTG